MKPSKTDIVIKGKNGLCGFKTTNLNFILRQGGVQNVVLGGFLTNCCIESTMRNAYELGYKVYTMEDCCAATSVGAHKAAYEHTFGMFSVPTNSNVSRRLRSLKKWRHFKTFYYYILLKYQITNSYLFKTIWH